MCEHCDNKIEAIKRIDLESLPLLKELLEQGYDKVKWVNTETACAKCQELDGKEWALEEYINAVHHDAGIFSHSHPNCLCYIIVTHPNGTEVKVNWEGAM